MLNRSGPALFCYPGAGSRRLPGPQREVIPAESLPAREPAQRSLVSAVAMPSWVRHQRRMRGQGLEPRSSRLCLGCPCQAFVARGGAGATTRRAGIVQRLRPCPLVERFLRGVIPSESPLGSRNSQPGAAPVGSLRPTALLPMGAGGTAELARCTAAAAQWTGWLRPRLAVVVEVLEAAHLGPECVFGELGEGVVSSRGHADASYRSPRAGGEVLVYLSAEGSTSQGSALICCSHGASVEGAGRTPMLMSWAATAR